VCIILGFAILKYNHWGEEGYQIEIPAKKSIVCSAVINLNMWTYNKAVITASFPAVVMVKSCSLLSVILIAIFCSRVKDKTLKLGTSKIWIGILVTIGIILFNYFKVSEGATDKSITLVSCALLFVSLLGDGILPDLQAEIKSLYKPSVMEMYFTINKYTALIALVYAIVTFQVTYIVNFIIDHSELQHDLLYFSILNAFGQLIVYRMIKLFKQHIPSFVIATRKCFTVIVNIIHFGHKINMLQGIGMSLVFFAVMVEVY
jgi:UDP-galactose transporter B1